MRVMLARLLLEKPSLLMLDEPTNHLDLPSIKWVESYLRNYEGAVVVVSHDRTFLNNVATKTVEVTNKTLNLYEGNYDFYVSEKALRTEIQQNAFLFQYWQSQPTALHWQRFPVSRLTKNSPSLRAPSSRITTLTSGSIPMPGTGR